MFKPFNGRVSMICDFVIRLGTKAISFAPRRFVQRSSEWVWEDTTQYGHFASNFRACPVYCTVLGFIVFTLFLVKSKRSFVAISIIIF